MRLISRTLIASSSSLSALTSKLRCRYTGATGMAARCPRLSRGIPVSAGVGRAVATPDIAPSPRLAKRECRRWKWFRRSVSEDAKTRIVRWLFPYRDEWNLRGHVYTCVHMLCYREHSGRKSLSHEVYTTGAGNVKYLGNDFISAKIRCFPEQIWNVGINSFRK